MRPKYSLKRKLITGVALGFILASSVNAWSHEDVRQPVVTFIDFYIAAQKANAPKISLWERVVYGLALARARTPQTPPAVNTCR